MKAKQVGRVLNRLRQKNDNHDIHWTIFSKYQAYAMLHSLTKLETSYMKSNVVPDPSSGTRAPIRTDVIQTLRVHLLDVLTSSVIQHNWKINAERYIRKDNIALNGSMEDSQCIANYKVLSAP